MRRKKKQCDPNDKEYMLRYVKGLLQRRPYPISALRKKLLRKGCNPDVVEEVMVKLKEVAPEELLNEEYLEALYMGACRKGKGPMWFRQRALMSGVPEYMVNSYIDSANWKDSLRVCVEKAKRKYDSDFYKIKGFLYRNGFNESFWDMAMEMLKEG
ncbi:MAG: hypothetical protein GXO59_05965 [Dictyoglomi bacterium]|nr:hypothetical protein [Dictyoglomota bacterium]